MIITKIFTFDAAHKLINYDGPCANLHGHTYKLYVSVKGPVKDGFVIDFVDLKKIVKDKVISKLDHITLNDVIKQPTAENIIIWIWKQLEKELNLTELKLYETPDSYAIYNGK